MATGKFDTTAGAGLEDSLQCALDYEAEVAYISLTSPVKATPTITHSDEEFDFSIENSGDLATQGEQALPPSPTLQGEQPLPPVPTLQGEQALPPNPTLQGEQPLPPDPTLQGEQPLSPSPTLQGEQPLPHIVQRGQTRVFDHMPPLLSKLRTPRPSLSEITAQLEEPDGDATPTDHNKSAPPSLATPTSPLALAAHTQPSPTPSPKPHPKLQQEEHQYSTLVVYGSSGCGRTHLVDKLAQSNPAMFAKVMVTTTRKKRPNEISGVDFQYLSHKEMAQGLARGDFVESIRVHRRGTAKREAQLRRTTVTQQASLHNISPALLHRPPLTSTPPLTRADTALGEGEYGSLFDLTEQDSPVMGGEVFATAYQSLTAAIQQAKPCILLNVSTKGAQQLKNNGIQASYVLVQNEHVPKDRHASKTRRSDRERGHDILTPDHVISSSSLDQGYSDLQDYALQLVSSLQLSSTSEYQVAKYEWEALPTVQFEQSNTLQNPNTQNPKLTEVTFSEILAYVHSSKLKQQKERDKATHSKRTFFSRLAKRLQEEKIMVHGITYCQLNDKERLHMRMLQTIYSKLTGNALTCRRFGAHWKEIGFSGIDPADDLQQIGLFGLVQLLYFLENSRTSHFCKEIFQYCHRDTHVIPFVAMAFEFSELSLQALDTGILNKICNKRDQVLVVMNEFYIASFHHYYTTWKASRKSILQLGLLMQQCGDYCKAHPQEVMQEFDKHLSVREPQNTLLPALLPKVENGFTPFDKIQTS